MLGSVVVTVRKGIGLHPCPASAGARDNLRLVFFILPRPTTNSPTDCDDTLNGQSVKGRADRSVVPSAGHAGQS